ncbi:hypothetical protein [[Mycobacterium] burgundiense]|uniref:Uncharacterized protein n=1 Tax=[Mycobacterium] burgundiense TaxID=3064286 RepID=A0ABM9LCU2_9MYCO|nr:hypothetical protein [Mycolicibacterium sp. MU0053]CAJ1496870.1 hypothetical protein MU0053_000763 [Mycolicibacterium sp. MU0053]
MRVPLSGVHAVCVGRVGVQVHRLSWATAPTDEARRDEMYRTVDGMTRWHSVTAELHSSRLPLAQWFRSTLPNTGGVFRAFRDTVVNPCIEPLPDIPSGTAGAAFDLLTRCKLGAPIVSSSVVEAIYDYCPSRMWAGVVDELISWLDRLILREMDRKAAAGADEGLLRGCWAIALLVELVRGVKFDRSALCALGDKPTCRDLVDVMPASAIADLRRLEQVFRDCLLPVINSRQGELVTGPAFSRVLPGDADLIKGNVLVEEELSIPVDRRVSGDLRSGLLIAV